MPARSLSRAALLVLLVAACSESPTRPENDARFDFINGPADLTNLERTPYGIQGIGFYDGETNLLLYAAPHYPACGPVYEAVSHTSVQDVGLLRKVINTLEMGRLYLYLYQGNPGTMRCGATPAPILAEGMGRFMHLDNDAQATGTRRNTFSWHLNGQVQFADESTALVAMVSRVLSRDGQYVEQAHNFRLTPSH